MSMMLFSEVKMDNKLYDVVAVGLNDSKVLWVDERKTKANAEAIVKMAVMRQGVEDRFFGIALHGKYKQGDAYTDSGLADEDADDTNNNQ